MKEIELTGKTVEEVITRFKAENKLEDGYFIYDVVQEPSSGFLGMFGKKEAIVRFIINAIEDEIKTFIEKLLTLSGLTIGEVVITTDKKYIYVALNNASDAGVLIGKEGRFMLSLQLILTQIFTPKDPSNRNVIVDVDGYKERQETNLHNKARQLAHKVIKTKTNITMDAMNASQRRVVHQAIKNIAGIKTMTIGEGQNKRIVLCPTGNVRYGSDTNQT